MKVKRGSTKVFLCVYIIVSTLLVTLIIRTFQASMDEQDQLVLYEKRLKKMRRLNTLYSDSSDPMKDIESLYIPTRNYADQPITTHQLLLDLLIQSGKLDPATDINPWLQISESLIYSVESYINKCRKLIEFRTNKMKLLSKK